MSGSGVFDRALRVAIFALLAAMLEFRSLIQGRPRNLLPYVTSIGKKRLRGAWSCPLHARMDSPHVPPNLSSAPHVVSLSLCMFEIASHSQFCLPLSPAVCSFVLSVCLSMHLSRGRLFMRVMSSCARRDIVVCFTAEWHYGQGKWLPTVNQSHGVRDNTVTIAICTVRNYIALR